jgi:hypothetical protein
MPMSMKKKWSKAQYGRERYLATEFLKSKSEQLSEGFDLKKLEIVIKSIQKKIAKQGRVTNARDEDHLKQLIKVYKQMGGKKIKEQINESKLREQIRGIIKEQLNEQKFKKVILPNDMKTKVKVSKMIKQLKLKIDKDYDVKALKARGGDQVISILPKHYNKFIELAMKNKLNPRG